MERFCSLSHDEEDELVQSNKKVKDSHCANEDNSSSWDGVSAYPSKLSFRDKLVGEILGAYFQSIDLSKYMDAESDSDEEVEEVREGIASVSLSKETKQCIRAPWYKVFIVKLFGKIVRYKFPYSRLMNLWKPSGRVDIVDLGRDFFLIRFSILEDLKMVLRKGSWFIGEHFLSIRR